MNNMHYHDEDGFVMNNTKKIVHLGKEPVIEVRDDSDGKVERDYFYEGEMISARVYKGKIVLFPFPECQYCEHNGLFANTDNTVKYCNLYERDIEDNMACNKYELSARHKSHDDYPDDLEFN